MTLIKTCRRDEGGALHYREAWDDGRAFLRHEGRVGTKGRRRNWAIRSTTRPDKPTAAEYFRAFREEAAADGFTELADEDLGWAVLQVQAATAGLGDPDDGWLLEDGAEALSDHLGWLGVEHYDGYDVGSAASAPDGTVVNLFCRVVDIPIGVRALRSFATRHGLPPRCLVAPREPGDESEYALAWSPVRSAKAFSL